MDRTEEYFPDHTVIDEWFYETNIPALSQLGTQYILTDYNILDDGKVYTKEIQQVIDLAAEQGGGVIVIPAGTYLSGALTFRQGVNLYVEKGGVLKGSDDLSDYHIVETRIEGETCLYVDALINADGLDGFVMCGPGTIDGNGLRSWKAFWMRRAWNSKCTNKDEQRARLVYISNCKHVLIAGLNLQNSQFWTTHFYKSTHVKVLGCRIFSPVRPVKSPSTDAIDIDVCTDVLIKNCYMEVNDDAVALKGGKGPWADEQPENGSNERILIEDCTYGFCHACLTCGSEAVHNRNIVLRRIKTDQTSILLNFKYRPDTPQNYEYIHVENVTGNVKTFMKIAPWSQFFDLKGRTDMPVSTGEHIVMKNCVMSCDTFFGVEQKDEQYRLSKFTFEDLKITAKKERFIKDFIQEFTVENVVVNDR